MEWLGDIPKQWESNRLKKYLIERNEKNTPVKTDNLLSVTMYQGVIPVSEKLGNGGNKPKENLENYKISYPNDIVLNSMNVIVGSVGLNKYMGLISPAYYALYNRNKNNNIKFFSYIFHNPFFQKGLFGLGNGIMYKESEDGKLNTIRLKIPMEKLNQVVLPCPSISEQNQIVSFLDTETTRIDNLITKQEKLIELLEEQRKSIISHAVTKGLNPNAPMKDSGVEWLGDVPSHWEVKPNKYIFKIQKLIAGKLGYDVLSITQKGLKVKDIESNAGQMAQDYSKYQIVNIGDFAMNHMDLLTGWIDVAKQRGVTSPDYRVFKLKNSNLNKQYFLNIFQMQYKQKILFAFGQGAAQMGRWRLQSEAFNKLKMPYPCIKEQVQIADFINHENLKINKLISKQQALIEKLKEYRTSIISHAVTGKIDVREFDA